TESVAAEGLIDCLRENAWDVLTPHPGPLPVEGRGSKAVFFFCNSSTAVLTVGSSSRPMGKRALHRKSGMVPAIVTVLLGWVLLLPQDPPGLMARWSYDLL